MTGPANDTPAANIGALLRQAHQELPPLDAQLLLAHVTGRTRTAVLTRPEQSVDPDAAERYRKLVAERVRGVPLAYLTGEREFWSLSLEVDRHTLVPRPETELLVELALAAHPDPAVIVDLGTGCGAIACALACERRAARVLAIDRSAAALRIAQRNSRRLAAGVQLVHGDWLTGVGDRCADLIVANPPYVRTGDPHLRADGVAFEPPLALLGGRDGLEAYRRIAPGAARCLRPGGWLLVEHGHDQAAAVADLLRAAALRDVRNHADGAGLPRVTAGRA